MGNRNARAFMKKREDEAAWTQATTEPRLAISDLHSRGIGLRRLQLIVCPSFEEARAWEVRQLGCEWSLFRCEVVSDWPELQLLGYYQLSIASDVLASIFSRIVALSLPITPSLNEMAGLDGEIRQLAIFGDMWSELRFQWWSEPPPTWQPLVEIAAEMVRSFSVAKVIS